MRSAAHAPGHAQPTPPWGGDTGLRSLETRVSAEFRDMPGMVLTRAQAARLFGLDAARVGA